LSFSPFRCIAFFALTAACTLLPAADSGFLAKRSGLSPILRHAAPTADSQPKLPAGLNLVDWTQIRAEYERHRHGMFSDGKVGFQSRSHYHGWLAQFDGKGFTVKSDTQAWSWGLELERWGRQGEEVIAGAAVGVHKDVNRLEYRRPGITEWFVNGEEGLEHGFTIQHRPGGAEGELSLQLRQRGELVAEHESEGRSVLYKTAQGAPALRYRKLLVTDARGRTLPARMVADGEWLRILVDDRRAVYPILVDPIVEEASLRASNAGANDYFGWSVAISGDTVVVGAIQEDSNATGVNGTESDNSENNSGAAYVFVVGSSGTWIQQAYLKSSNPGANGYFGYSVAISGDTVVVGAAGEGSNSGAGYVFVRTSGTWSQQAYLKASNAGKSDQFGASVAIDGDTVVVGAQGEDSNATGVNGTESDDSGFGDSGAAYVFVRSSGTWTQQAYLKASNTGANGYFGWSVAVSGDTVVVGAVYESYEFSQSGAAYVFVRTSGKWSQQAYLKASNAGTDYYFGSSVAISGDTVVVGEMHESYGFFQSGAAYVFVRTSGKWSQQAYLKASNAGAGDEFGYSVAISGDTLVVGADQEASNATGVNGNQSDDSLPGAGAAYVFLRSSGIWTQQAYLKGPFSVFSVAISGATMVIGHRLDSNPYPNYKGASGSASVFMVQPEVTAISPSSGPLAGGQSVTITGFGFTGATAVTIGGTAATAVTVVSTTSITATTPAGSAGAASVLVTTPAGTNSANALYTHQVAPTVTSISPSSGPLTGGESVTITGTDFTTETLVTIGGKAASAVTFVSSTSITATTPAGSAGTASVLVTTPSGTNSANTLYAYQGVPTVASISPSSGPLAGGQSVTITGTGFTGATAVSIGGTAATAVTVVNATTITATTAAGSAGTASVLVTTAFGTNSANTLYTHQAAPTVTSVSPSLGPLAGGQSVTITGTGFTGATAVTIGGTAATAVTVVSSTSLTATTPAGSAGTASVLVTTPSGTNSANTLYTHQAAPTVTSISPSSGPLTGGQLVTITGTNFTGETSVTIGGTAATLVTVVSSTSITAKTPAGSAGTASVLVTTPEGTNSANTLYTHQAAPTVTSISPSSGPLAGGQAVTITGTDFTGATAVTIGGTAATAVTVVNATTITATTPAGSAGTASVLVTTPSGTYSAGALYTHQAAPTVTSISPSSGPLAGGQSVTITGTGFTGATAVTIGGTAATAVIVTGSTSLTAIAPAGSAGTASVLVTTPGGTNSANTLYTHQAAPTVTSISPSSGPLTGGQSVTITGTDFTGATSVTIGGTAATVVIVVSSTSITATTPAGSAGTASVLVTTPGGTNSANTLYTHQAAAPTVTSISPSLGPLTGGQSVTITGTGFTGATAVTIGGTAATAVTVVSSTSLTATTPAGSAGTASVLVTTPGGTNSANTLYTHQAAPTVTSISPSSGPLTGGQSVTITGTDFTGATSVTIGGTAATVVIVVSSTSITAKTPAGSAGTASVLVTTPSGTNSANTLYTHQAAPTVTSISPSSGPLAGGQAVTITGTNFTGATAVTIGGTAATGVTVVTATTITATTPAGSAGTASVLVTTPSGTYSAGALYTHQAAPTVTSISPSSGSLTGGQPVTVKGTGFTGVTSVTIGGTAATAVIVTGSTSLTAITPAGSAGTASVLVTTPGGTNSANTLYTYQAGSTATALRPSSGPLAGGQSVTFAGSGFTGATAVAIGGTAATAVTLVGSTAITAATSVGRAGTASVLVTSTGGANSANTLYTYQAVAAVTFISPSSVPLAAVPLTGE